MPTDAATRQVLFPSFSPVIERLGAKACRDPDTLIGASDRHSADHLRRRLGPVRISTRRNPPLASSLISNIAIAPSPQT